MRSTEHCLAYSSSLWEHLAISRGVFDGHSWGRGMCEGATSSLWVEARYNHCTQDSTLWRGIIWFKRSVVPRLGNLALSLSCFSFGYLCSIRYFASQILYKYWLPSLVSKNWLYIHLYAAYLFNAYLCVCACICFYVCLCTLLFSLPGVLFPFHLWNIYFLKTVLKYHLL